MRCVRGWLPVVLLVTLLGLAFQGSRGIWEPDEGFYTNVAVGMLRSGDWLLPRLNGEPFLDKPPLHYWGMALGMELLGRQEWGARAANALWFMATALAVGALARSLWGDSTGRLAALIFATMPIPFASANVLTPDMPLAFWSVLSVCCYVRVLRTDSAGRRAAGWWLALGVAMGLGMLTKGPAMWIFLAPLALHFVLTRGLRRALLCPWGWLSSGLAVAIGASWYLLMMARLPGAGAYFLDNEIVGRLFTDTYRRNPELLGGVLTYGPVLTLGALPWSAAWPILLGRLCPGLRCRPTWRALRERRVALLLFIWLALPLATLFMARSRLPLYALPLFAPMALVTARALMLARAGTAWASRLRPAVVALALWCLCLIGAKVAAAEVPINRDTRALAAAIRDRIGAGPVEVVSVDGKHNGLPFYGFRDFEWITVRKNQYPYFSRTETLDTEIREVLEEKQPHLFVVPRRRLGKVEHILSDGRLGCRTRGDVQDDTLLWCDPRTGVHPSGGY